MQLIYSLKCKNNDKFDATDLTLVQKVIDFWSDCNSGIIKETVWTPMDYKRIYGANVTNGE